MPRTSPPSSMMISFAVMGSPTFSPQTMEQSSSMNLSPPSPRFTRFAISRLPLIILKEMARPNVPIKPSRIFWPNSSWNTKEIGAITYQAPYSSPEQPAKLPQGSLQLTSSMVTNSDKHLTTETLQPIYQTPRLIWIKKCPGSKRSEHKPQDSSEKHKIDKN